tara:strand:+ start:4802 stop:5077 length:276 start_codon:yes stop_codon:yes gene_type:complete
MTWKDMLKKDDGRKELRREILHHRRKKESKKRQMDRKNQDSKKPKRKVNYANPTRLEDFPEHIKGISLPSSFDPDKDSVEDYLKDPKRFER